MLLGWPRFEERLAAEFWAGYGDTAVQQRLAVLGPFYAYRIAAHCCLRLQQLALTNSVASVRYGKVFEWLVGGLDG